MARFHRLVLILLGCNCAPEGELQFAEIVAASKWVEYGAWADLSMACMDDRLDRWDGYIENIAGFLQVAPPAAKIRYIWVPEGERDPARWPCAASDGGCERQIHGQPTVFAGYQEMLHEVVHGVELSALGNSHPAFNEGMAEYLSRSDSTGGLLDSFVDAFTAAVDRDLKYQDYVIYMHFVGSLIERHGIDRYQVFRSRVPVKGRFEDFASAYQEVFGDVFTDALMEMSLNPIVGRWAPWGCTATEPAVEWPTEGTINLNFGGECGDPGFYGAGTADGEPGFVREFAVEVQERGYYESVALEGVTTPYSLVLSPCPGTNVAAVVGSDTQPFAGVLEVGRYSLQVSWAADAPASPELTLAVSRLL